MRYAATFFALLVLASCSASGTSNDSPDAETGPLHGQVTDVTVEDDVVTGFELNTGEDTVTIAIDPERDYGFDLFHLEEHVSSGDPVLVETETEGDDLVALSIEDA